MVPTAAKGAGSSGSGSLGAACWPEQPPFHLACSGRIPERQELPEDSQGFLWEQCAERDTEDSQDLGLLLIYMK